MGIIRTKSHTPPPKRRAGIVKCCASVISCDPVVLFVFVSFFLVFVPVVDPQVSRPKVKKKRLKKRGKEKGKKKKFFFFFSSERARTSFLFQSTMRRQVLGQPVGMNERENLGLPAFSTKSACSRVEVTPPPSFLPIFSTRPRSYESSCALQQPFPRVIDRRGLLAVGIGESVVCALR